MDEKLISLKCPECGADLSVEEGRTYAFCTYCGAKIIIVNENELIYRSIDETAIHISDNERDIRMKELEAEAVRREDTRNYRRKKYKVLGILGGSAALLILLAVILIMIDEDRLGPLGFVLFCFGIILGIVTLLVSTGLHED